MIRPYLTVLNDSFHEAFASRVLWVVLVVSTLILAALLPMALKQQSASKLYSESIENWPDLLTKIKAAGDRQEPSPGKQVWTLADDDFRTRVTKVVGSKDDDDEEEHATREDISHILKGFNEVLERKDFYDESAWANVRLSRRSSEVIADGISNLTDEQRFVFNRNLLRDAFPKMIEEMPEEELVFTYLGNQVGGPLPISRQLAKPIINQLVGQVMNFFVGTIGIFVGILVTASIIPQTYEAGAIDLLLSKPVSRSMLFLVKFLGGCVFVLLTSSYFIVGLWLILGWRLEEWNSSLLLCIPIFMFQFVIYYSISAAAGVFWRNATLSIVMTILFWVCCTTIGTVKGVVQELFINPGKIEKIVPTNDGVIVINQSNDFLEWNVDSWQVAMKSQQQAPPFGGGPELTGLFYDPGQSRLIFGQSSAQGRRSGFFASSSQIVTAKWSDGVWKQETGPTIPNGTTFLFVTSEQKIAAVCPTGIFEVDFDKHEPQLFGITIPGLARSGARQLIADTDFSIDSGFVAAVHPTSHELAIISEGKLNILTPDEKGMYRKRVEKAMSSETNAAAIAFGAATTFVLLDDGSIEIYRNDDLSLVKSIAAERPEMAGSHVVCSADGQTFAVRWDNGFARIYNEMGESKGRLIKDTTAIAFDGNDTLLVATGNKKIYASSLADSTVAVKYNTRREVIELFYDYLISPVYELFPKPAQLSALISGLMDNDDTPAASRMSRFSRRGDAETNKYFYVIVSNLAFVVVVLGATSLYVARSDY